MPDPYGEEIDRPVVVRASEYTAGYSSALHWHGRAQLVYACTGVVQVTTQQGAWVVPQHRGVWIPARTAHQIKSAGQVFGGKLSGPNDADEKERRGVHRGAEFSAPSAMGQSESPGLFRHQALEQRYATSNTIQLQMLDWFSISWRCSM